MECATRLAVVAVENPEHVPLMPSEVATERNSSWVDGATGSRKSMVRLAKDPAASR
jgi:hypothetical protein